MKKKILSAIVMMAFLPAISQTFDPGFGDGGKIITHLGDANSSAITDVKFLPNGKILVCGQKKVDYLNKFVVARYNADGALDPDFGTDGMALYDIGSNDGSAHSLWLLPDGKFFVAGEYLSDYFNQNLTDFALVRCNADGSLDTTFGTNGWLTTDASGITKVDAGYSIFVDSQGKILIAGEASHSGSNTIAYTPDFAVVRYNSDGTLDESFAANGIFKENIGQNSATAIGSVDYLYQVQEQPDGKLMLCGFSDAGSEVQSYNVVLMRLNNDGSADSTFGTLGKIIMNLGNIESIHSVHILPDGKYIGVARTFDPNILLSGKSIVFRLNADGSPDTSFGNGGFAEANFDAVGNVGIVTDTALLSNGKIVVAGYKVDGIGTNGIVLLFNSDGTLDQNFDTDGRIEFDFMGGIDRFFALDVAASGDFVIAGGTTMASTTVFDFVLAKFTNQDLGVQHQEPASQLSVYPNPFSSQVTVTGFTPGPEISLSAFDVLGRKIFAGKQSSATFDMPDDLPKGIYLLHLTNGEATAVRKVVKK